MARLETSTLQMPPLRRQLAWWVLSFPVALVAALALDSLYLLNWVHVLSGVLWTGADLFMGFIVGPVLRSLEEAGLLESNVEPSISGPPRRYYRITPNGRDTLKRWVAIWNQSKAFVSTILEGN